MYFKYAIPNTMMIFVKQLIPAPEDPFKYQVT